MVNDVGGRAIEQMVAGLNPSVITREQQQRLRVMSTKVQGAGEFLRRILNRVPRADGFRYGLPVPRKCEIEIEHVR